MTNWIFLGNTGATPLENSLKMAAWSRGLRRVLGVGYAQYLMTPAGDAFAPTDEVEMVESRLRAEQGGLDWMRQTDEVSARLHSAVSAATLDVPAALLLVEEHFTFFFITVEALTHSYEDPATDAGDRRAMEQWRNDDGRFAAHVTLWPRLAAHVGVTLEEIERASADELLVSPLLDLASRHGGSLVLDDGIVRYDPADRSPSIQTAPAGPLHGTTAFGTGKIRGVVGKDILVATMTTPDMLPIIRGMRAVITDDGGVLCHAAITCRELKIPCIIGTGHATRVLKDGDEVEVDATNGTVRIL